MHGIPYVNVRIFNCTGPRKINDFVSDVCRRVVNKEFPLKVGNLDGLRSIVRILRTKLLTWGLMFPIR